MASSFLLSSLGRWICAGFANEEVASKRKNSVLRSQDKVGAEQRVEHHTGDEFSVSVTSVTLAASSGPMPTL